MLKPKGWKTNQKLKDTYLLQKHVNEMKAFGA